MSKSGELNAAGDTASTCTGFDHQVSDDRMDSTDTSGQRKRKGSSPLLLRDDDEEYQARMLNAPAAATAAAATAAVLPQVQQQSSLKKQQGSVFDPIVYKIDDVRVERIGELMTEIHPLQSIAFLHCEFYVLCDQIKMVRKYVWTNEIFQLKSSIPIGVSSGELEDIISCTSNSCLYISHKSGTFMQSYSQEDVLNILKIKVSERGEGFPITCLKLRKGNYGGSGRIAVNEAGQLLIVDRDHNCIEIYDVPSYVVAEFPQPKATVKLPDGICPMHAVQTSKDSYIVTYEWHAQNKHGLLHVNELGVVLHSFGSNRGSAVHELNGPAYITLDQRGFVYVADYYNHRVVVLDPDLRECKTLISRDDDICTPFRVTYVPSCSILLIATLNICNWAVYSVKK